MSGLKNSPFGKRLRASQQETDDDTPRRNRPRINPIFGVSPAGSATPSLDSRPTTSSDSSGGPDSPVDPPRIARDYGDRFVPSRDTGDMRTSYHLMEQEPSTPSKKNRIIPSESDALKEQANALFSSILHTEVTPPSPHRPSSPTRPPVASTSATPSTPTRRRLFAYSSPSHSNPSTPSRRLDTPTDEAYSMSPVRAQSRQLLESPRRQLRSVCKTPYRVLDAPELAEDFYLNLVDWSSTNVLGVGLGTCVYLWTAHNAAVSKLCDLGKSAGSVSSVSWVQKGSTLAVGTLSGALHVYDASTLQLIRSYPQAHSQRIGAIAWNAHILSSGSRDRLVHHRDVREQQMRPFKRCQGHRQEVCGLKWSSDGGPSSANLASGGNDNKVCIWDLRGSRRAAAGLPNAGRPVPGMSNGDDTGPGDIPLWKFHEHTAAVKALAWDPHVSGVLATGGGTQDKHIRFWNTGTGTMLNELDTGSQVCNLIWSMTSHELVSTHGFSSTTAQNQICIWKYPTLDMVASLSGHTNRVLYLAMSPDGETIVTGAGDETLRFWNAFPKKESGEKERDSRLDYGKLIR
ncbi:WD40 repeat-like protein [Lentinula aff. detonsa]|uniref:WD40 repeat-like protein n=1 Tax=Lentinula aff. detonsa TaxID=2804958 RepID=A0AA38NQM6_9AGAR|nr:WD40 repeat-like protein [Lentinula aff. detonsa]KAJ3793315.1 WD40 repeat-like protein [Lentinula aff. detonsa]